MKAISIVKLKEGVNIPPDILKHLEKGFLKDDVNQPLKNTKKISSVLKSIKGMENIRFGEAK